MLKVEHAEKNYAILTDGEAPYVLPYGTDHLRKYSELLKYPAWTEEKVLKELSEDIEVKIMLAFRKERIEDIREATLLIMPYASANLREMMKEGAQ